MKVQGRVITDGNTAYVLTQTEAEKLDRIVAAISEASAVNYKNYRYKRDSGSHERSQARVESLVDKFQEALSRVLGNPDNFDDVCRKIYLPVISDVQCRFGAEHFFEAAAKELLKTETAKREAAAA
ncbi:MAG TPA: hypothetical protein VGR55_00580 [Candidatus Acidoferrum sp.]|nr:hypothetical protein [Candidatus Acidoferrum sp.]